MRSRPSLDRKIRMSLRRTRRVLPRIAWQPVYEPLDTRLLLTQIAQVANFEGLSEANTNSGTQPPDPSAAAGPSSLLSTVNRQITLSNRDGSNSQTANLGGSGDFFSRVDHGQWIDDSSVLYDTYSDRLWVLTNEGSFFDIAVSKASSPQDLDLNESTPDDWWFYSIPGSYDFGQGAHGADFPRFAVDATGVYITANYPEDDAVLVVRLDKMPMLSGTLGSSISVPLTGEQSLQPVQSVGRASTDPQMFVEAIGSGIKVWEMSSTGQMNAKATLYSSFTWTNTLSVPQKGTPSTLWTIDPRLMNAVFQNGFIWTAHTVPLNGQSVVRWYEISTSGGYAIVQQSDINPGPGISTLCPAIAVDAAGDMGITYTQTSASQYPAMMFTGRGAGDPAGTTQPGLVVHASPTFYNGDVHSGNSMRWGDFAGLAVDPNGASVFWPYNEYAETPAPGTQYTDWGTWWGEYTFGSAGPTVVSPAAASPATVSGPTGTTTALSVLGNDPAGESSLTYTWQATSTPPGAQSPTFSANGTNAAKSTTATFSHAGNYTFQVTLSDGSATATSSVSVAVNQTLTRITISPAGASLNDGASQTFAATGLDQFGNGLTSPQGFTWSVSPGGVGGTINSAGTYTAPSTGTGTDTIAATSGSVQGTESVSVTTQGTLVDRSTNSGGSASAKGEYAAAGQVASNLFDGDLTTTWLDFESSSWVQYQFANNAAYVITQYEITSGGDTATYPGRAPKDWVLEGSNNPADDNAWVPLDTRTNQADILNVDTKTYPVANTTAYKAYRLLITQSNGDNIVQLTELKLLGPPTSTQPTTTQVDLSSWFNLDGITDDDNTVPGNIDGYGYSYSADLLTSAITLDGATYAIGTPDTNNVVVTNNQTITLPSGNYGKIILLASSITGAQTDTFTVNYANSPSVPFTQTIDNWCNYLGQTNETVAKSMSYRNGDSPTANSSQVKTNYVYAFGFTLDSTKTVQSITLPNNASIRLLAIDLMPPALDLAQGKTVVASWTEGSSYTADKAVDGDSTTRWSSAQWTQSNSTGWIYVDLGAVYNITEVLLNWETAYAVDYQIQVSNDPSDPNGWTNIATITGNSTSGAHDYTGLSGSGRYVRIYCTAVSAANNNYSLYDFKVYGS